MQSHPCTGSVGSTHISKFGYINKSHLVVIDTFGVYCCDYVDLSGSHTGTYTGCCLDFASSLLVCCHSISLLPVCYGYI